MICRRMPLVCSRATWRSSVPMNSRISSDTSSAGRRQFSELNANSVRCVMPRTMHASTISSTRSTPFEWPAARGRWRAVAQRPLPSMMIAT